MVSVFLSHFLPLYRSHTACSGTRNSKGAGSGAELQTDGSALFTLGWIGSTAETLGDVDRAVAAYESALRHNAYCVDALAAVATICRSREEFKKAAEYFGRVVGIAPESGDIWGALGEDLGLGFEGGGMRAN